MIFYLCDGQVPDCKKGGCFLKGHDCRHTSDIDHAVNFRKSIFGDHYFEIERKGDEMRRKLDYMPFDKSFDGGFSLCHATGYEVCLGNPDNPADWWNEYEDQDGNIEYGR